MKKLFLLSITLVAALLHAVPAVAQSESVVTLAGNARHVYGDFQGKPALSELIAGIPIGVGDRGGRRQVMALSNGICLEPQWFG